MIDKYTRKASPGTFRVIGYDQYDYSDFFVGEFDNMEEAIELIKVESSTPNAIPASFSNIYFVYNDKKEALYKASFEEGLKNLTDTNP
jgi:hypothetical protein